MRLPDDLTHLQTDELVAKLARLTQRQVDGIARIIAAGYHTEARVRSPRATTASATAP